MSEPPWWKTSVVYQIYPRSFCDTNGDGVGDLAGIRRHLDHLEWLGVDAIWLSPFYRSPMADFGYDISDYCDVDPLFGTLADFDALVEDAHDRGIRIIVDWVPNHTSDQHPWFVESRSGRDNPRRDWYLWRDPAPGGGPPNNWVAAFTGGPAWTYDDATGQYYLHSFLPAQPDLNWANPEVVEAMHDVLRFWLDRGVDGFRVDVVHLIGKAPDLPDDPEEYLPIPHSGLNHRPETHELLRGLRRLLDSYPGDRMMVGEVYLLDTTMVATYYGSGDELHLAFNFPPLYTPWDAERWRSQIEIVSRELDPIGAWPTWVLSNHDNKRHRTRYGGSEARARAAAVLLLGLRGTPFLYAGEELGLEDAVVPDDRVVDPGGRDGCRAPIPWEPAPPHGWAGADPWLPWPPEPGTRNVVSEREDPASILHLYRRLLAARRRSPSLREGDLSLIDAPPGVLAWRRAHQSGDERVLIVNFSAERVTMPPSGLSGLVEVASDGSGEGALFTGEVGPDQALLIDPGATAS
ncbi:alpha-amylase family glycosyl hydrolase [Rhabdothermincola sediminis]|uniref:alpha-amylase family glycosyl hydrolase n=1 Tax=Rhabdothermincola sediminis TaxID=2751370 RepID=UPI001AA0485F|nr:alpha-amylase family glycosyl hydrolase [Rhabdothermincola sediminis]